MERNGKQERVAAASAASVHGASGAAWGRQTQLLSVKRHKYMARPVALAGNLWAWVLETNIPLTSGASEHLSCEGTQQLVW